MAVQWQSTVIWFISKILITKKVIDGEESGDYHISIYYHSIAYYIIENHKITENAFIILLLLLLGT